MAKDPAFLFYYQDFLVGTEFMSNQEVGCYIRILCHMAHKGRMTQDQMAKACRNDSFAYELKEKFKQDENGLFYNERLEKEVEKRRLYSLSRSKNRTYKKKIRKSYVRHMENENVNENVNENNKNNENEKQKFTKPNLSELKSAFEEKGYPITEADKFLAYYETVGWVVGHTRKPMKNWRGAVATWCAKLRDSGVKPKNRENYEDKVEQWKKEATPPPPEAVEALKKIGISV